MSYKENRICIWGAWYTSHNAGDKAILRTIVSSIRKLDPKIDFTVFSSDPDFVSNNFSLKSINTKYQPLKFLKEIRNSKVMLIGGGTPIYDDLAHMLYFLAIVLSCKLFGTKVMFYGASAQNVKKSSTKYIARIGLNLMDGITVREALTGQFLEEIGVKKHIEVLADPAIICASQPVDLVESSPDKKKIGIFLHFFSNTDAYRVHHYEAFEDETIANYMRIMQEVTQRLSDQYELYFIPMNTDKPDSDVDSAEEILRNMEPRENIHNITKQYEPEEIVGILNNLDLIIGTRLHSLILSASAGTPFVAISYAPKVQGFCNRINLEKYCLDIRNLKAETVLKKVDEIVSNHAQIQSRIKQEVEHLKKLVARNAAIAYELYSNID